MTEDRNKNYTKWSKTRIKDVKKWKGHQWTIGKLQVANKCVMEIPKGETGIDRKHIWRHNGYKIFKFDVNYKRTHPQISGKLKHKNYEENYTMAHHIQIS